MLFSKKKKDVEEVKTSPDEFRDDEFDFDFEDDFDFDDPTSRKPTLKKTAGTIIKSASEPLAREASKAVMTKVLPPGFEYDYRELKEMGSFTGNLLKKSFQEVRDSAGRLLPKHLQDKIGVRDPSDVYRPKTDRQLREESIAASLENVFKNSHTGKEEDVRIVDNTGDKALDVANLSLLRIQNNFLGDISNNTSKLTSFFLSIGRSYYQKSLELKYRSFYIQQDQLNVTARYLGGITKQLELVIKNTALPENVKITQADRLSTKFKQNLTDSIYQRTWSNNEYIKRFKTNAERKLKEITDFIKESSEAALTTKDMMSGIVDDLPVSKAEIAADRLGALFGYIGGNILGNKLGDTYNKRFGGKDDVVQAIAKKISLASTGLPSLIEKVRRKVEQGEDDSYSKEGFRGVISRGVYGIASNALDLLDRDSRSSSMRKELFTSFNKPAIFDNNVHRSITEGIPKYLSAILKETQELNQRYGVVNKVYLQKASTAGELQPVKPLVFSYHDRDLVTVDSLKSSIDARLMENTGRQSGIRNANTFLLRTARDNISRSKDPLSLRWRNILNSKDVDKSLNEYLTDISRYDGVDLSYESLFEKALDEDEADPMIAEYLRSRKDLKNIIRAINESSKVDGREKETELAKKRFALNLESGTKDYPTTPIIELFESVSKLAKSTHVNSLSNEQATIISRAFAGRIYNNMGRPVLATEEDLRSVLKYIPESSLSSIKDVYTIFLSDVMKVLRSPLRADKATMDLLFNEVSTSIMSRLYNIGPGEDSLKSLFEEVGQLHPELQVTGPLDHRNFIEKTITTVDLGDMVSDEEIENILKDAADENVVKSFRDKSVDEQLVKEATGTRTGGITINKVAMTPKPPKPQKPPVVRKRKLANNVKDLTGGLSKRELNGVYSKVKSNSNDISKVLKNINEEGVRKSSKELSDLLAIQSNTIKELINLEHQEWKPINEFLREQVEEIKREGSDKYKEARASLMNVYDKRVRRSIAFEAIKDRLKDLSVDLADFSINYNEESFEDGFKELRDKIEKVLEDIKSTLAKEKDYLKHG